MQQKIIIFTLIAICILLGIWIVWERETRDVIPPVISFNQEDIVYQEGTNKSALLKGVTAEDAHDGDVSNNLVIGRIVYNEGDEKATVFYYAYDKNNNIAEAEREVYYIPDKNAGTSSGSPDNSVSAAKKNNINVTIQPGLPSISMVTNSVSLAVGAEFNPLDYVAAVSADSEGAKIVYSTGFTTKVADTYIIQFYVEDESGYKSNTENLTLIVN